MYDDEYDFIDEEEEYEYEDFIAEINFLDTIDELEYALSNPDYNAFNSMREIEKDEIMEGVR